MGLFDKLKNVFFEEEEIEEELEETKNLARKVEVPKKEVQEPIQVREESVPKERIIIPKPEPRETKEVEEEKKPVKKEEPQNYRLSMMFEEEDFVFEKPQEEEEESRPLYPEHREESYKESIKKESNGYAYSKTYYESKETKTFTPSPIISPIYGILDKNYKKEEVVTKKEIRITSSHGKMDLDSVRNKAFGENEGVIKKEKPKVLSKHEQRVYDVTKDKPSVTGVTLEDADEYYNDLGLAYNVDYKDRAREEDKKIKSEKVITNISRRTEKNKDDNLFDLIESMYDKEE